MYQGFEADKAAVEMELKNIEDEISHEHATESTSSEAFFAEEATPSYQYKNRFIVTSLKSGLVLIDQHRAHVRILFDSYLAGIGQHAGVSQQVLFPEIIEFSPAEMNVLPTLLDDLSSVGFDLADLGNGSFSINGLPAGIENIDQVKLLKDIVASAIETGCDVHAKIAESIALSLAKAAAIPNGKNLSAEEMDHLIASLFSCQESNLTPEGKTIISLVTDEELEKRFK